MIMNEVGGSYEDDIKRYELMHSMVFGNNHITYGVMHIYVVHKPSRFIFGSKYNVSNPGGNWCFN